MNTVFGAAVAAGLGAMILVSSGAATAGVNLVSNPSFSTGDLTDWSGSTYAVFTSALGTTPYPGDTYFAATYCGVSTCSLTQTLATTPGQKYTFSFAYNPGEDAAAGADTFATFNGVEVVDATEGPLGWTTYTVPGLLATSFSTVVSFESYVAIGFGGIDNVSVTVGVPEPATWALALIGLGGVGAAIRVRRTTFAMGARSARRTDS